MANTISSIKPGACWKAKELEAFKIHVTEENTATFFGVHDLPEPTVDPIILDNLEAPPGPTTDTTRPFFAYLKNIEGLPPGREMENAGFNFVYRLLRDVVGYTPIGCSIYWGSRIRFTMCGKHLLSTPGIGIMDAEYNYVLMVHQDKRRGKSDKDPEAELIATAIAAFSRNNKNRESQGLLTIPEKIVAGIVWRRTIPTFYKIPVTAELVQSIENAQPPPRQTIVHKLIPPVSDIIRTDGMFSLEDRRIILQCIEAFRQFFQQ